MEVATVWYLRKSLPLHRSLSYESPGSACILVRGSPWPHYLCFWSCVDWQEPTVHQCCCYPSWEPLKWLSHSSAQHLARRTSLSCKAQHYLQTHLKCVFGPFLHHRFWEHFYGWSCPYATLQYLFCTFVGTRFQKAFQHSWDICVLPCLDWVGCFFQ